MHGRNVCTYEHSVYVCAYVHTCTDLPLSANSCPTRETNNNMFSFFHTEFLNLESKVLSLGVRLAGWLAIPINHLKAMHEQQWGKTLLLNYSKRYNIRKLPILKVSTVWSRCRQPTSHIFRSSEHNVWDSPIRCVSTSRQDQQVALTRVTSISHADIAP
jgi:hypothetical protein